MKVRKFEFKSVSMSDRVWDASLRGYKTVEQGVFDYREILRTVLLVPQVHQQGEFNTTEQVIRSIKIYSKFEESKDHLLLDAEEHRYLVERVNNHRWGQAHKATVDFIEYVRNLPEIEVEEVKKASS